jgi:hypothetical protein
LNSISEFYFKQTTVDKNDAIYQAELGGKTMFQLRNQRVLSTEPEIQERRMKIPREQVIKIQTSKDKMSEIPFHREHLARFDSTIKELIANRQLGRIWYIAQQIDKSEGNIELKGEMQKTMEELLKARNTRLREILPKKTAIKKAAMAPNRSEEYKIMWQASGVGEDVQKIEEYVSHRYGPGDETSVRQLQELGATYLPLVFDMGLMSKAEHVEDFSKYVQERNLKDKDPWENLEAFRQHTREDNPQIMYRGLNLDQATLQMVEENGMYPPAYMHFIKARDPVGREPEVEELIERPLETMVLNRVVPTTRHMNFVNLSRERGAETSLRRQSNRDAVSKEDLFQSVSRHRAIAGAVAGDVSYSGGTYAEQSLYVFEMKLSPIDVISPVDVIKDQQQKQGLPTTSKLVFEDSPDQEFNYDDGVELVVPGRIYSQEIAENPSCIDKPARHEFVYEEIQSVNQGFASSNVGRHIDASRKAAGPSPAVQKVMRENLECERDFDEELYLECERDFDEELQKYVQEGQESATGLQRELFDGKILQRFYDIEKSSLAKEIQAEIQQIDVLIAGLSKK